MRPRVPGHPAAWLGLLLGGQLATLQWIEAGPRVAYQHYLPPDRLLSEAPAWSFAVVGLEVLAVLVALARLRPWPRPAAVSRAVLLACAAAFVLTSATLSREPVLFGMELVLASAVQLLHLLTVVVLALSLGPNQNASAGRLTDRLLGPFPTTRGDAEPGGPDRFAWAVAGVVTLVAAALAVWSYQRHPHVPDEVSYLLQARYFAAGQLSLPLPPVPAAFDVDLMTYQSTRWFSPVPPGWPLVLAVGALAGVPWLVNPVLGGLCVVLAYVALREWHPRRTARLAILLLAASPWHLFLSMSLMTHPASLAAALVAAVGVGRFRRGESTAWAIVAGVAIALVGLIRPLEGLAVAGVLGLWSLTRPGGGWRLGPTVVMGAACLAASAVVFPYNAHLTGSARTFPIMAYTDALFGPGTNALGFGANRGLPWPGLDPLPGHGPVDVLINSNLNLFQVNTELHGWAAGSLVAILVLAAVGRWRRSDAAMLVPIFAIVGLHALYYFSGGPDFGARYWYLILVPALALSARGIEETAAALGAPGTSPDPRPFVAAGALILAAVVIFVPWRAADKYHHYRRMRPDPRAIAASLNASDAILLVRGRRHPDFASAVAYNPLDLTGPGPIFAWDRDDTVRGDLVRAYPDRRFWIIEGPSVTGEGFVVTAGPMSGSELLARRDTVLSWP